jgi:hypothetical protein
MLWALDAAKGEKLFEKHLEIPSAGSPPGMPAANLYASLAVAADELFIGNDSGTWLVLSAVKEYKELATSTLPEGSGASAVFDGERLYLRGGKKLYCIGAK